MNKEKNKKCNFCGVIIKKKYNTVKDLGLGTICALCNYKMKIFHIF
tara:strand:- start:562 stop:699 length:138 start_codon:yes stop_codon:yes gene_type:complete